MSNPLATFQFNSHQLDVIIDDQQQPWFIAKQVAEIFDYSDAEAMTRRLDDDEKSNRQIVGLGPDTGGRGTICINESGLYSVTLTSQKPIAKLFKKWVTSEVLPSIRKTGSYAVAEVESALFQQKYYAQLEENGTLKSKIIDLLEQASVKEQQLLAQNKRPTTNKMSLDEKKDIIRLHLAGNMIPAVCKEVGRGRTSVRKTIRAFKDTGDIS